MSSLRKTFKPSRTYKPAILAPIRPASHMTKDKEVAVAIKQTQETKQPEVKTHL